MASSYAQALAASQKLPGATVMKLAPLLGYAVKVTGERGSVRAIDGVPVRYEMPKTVTSGIRTCHNLRRTGKGLGAE